MVVVPTARTTRPSGSSGSWPTDPGTGVLRHLDAGYDEAKEAARHGLEVPGA